jgi:hypothetical protein
MNIKELPSAQYRLHFTRKLSGKNDDDFVLLYSHLPRRKNAPNGLLDARIRPDAI